MQRQMQAQKPGSLNKDCQVAGSKSQEKKSAIVTPQFTIRTEMHVAFAKLYSHMKRL